MSDDCVTPVLLSLTLIAEVLNKPVQSVHRWNTSAVKGARLPRPDVTVGSTPLWFEATILEYADRRGLHPNYPVLESIRARQTVG